MARRRKPSAARQKKKYKTRLEREWGKKAYILHGGADYHSPYPQEYCEILRGESCKCAILPSIRAEYAARDYWNVWTSCRGAAKIIKEKRRW